MSKYFKAEIAANNSVNGNHNLLVLSSQDILETPAPGQFYMIGTNNSYDPLLKRPFSIFKKESGSLQFLYRLKGKGTKILNEMKKGDTVRLLGPLGNGYPMPSKNAIPVLIAGGVGIASLFSLAERLSGNVHFFYGARSSDELLMLNELKGLVKKELIISTDNGSEGKQGTVIDILKNFLASDYSLLTSGLIYACGPSLMLEAVSKLAAEKGIKGYISVEENMACGVGACLGCTVKTKKGYKRVCKEGPVFLSSEILWT